jgi:hypothetical protein
MAETTYDPTAPVRYTVTPRVFSEVNLRTRPRAVCTIDLDGSRDPNAALRIHADATGMVRFNVRPSGESEELLKLSIECELDGKVTHYPLDLRASFEPTRELPAPPAYESEVTAEGWHRPALTAREMIDLPGDVLLERGYPLRPDRHQAPLAYRTWCRMAAAPMTIVPAHLTPRPDIQPGKGAPTEAAVGTSNIWSGFVGTRDNSKAKLTWPGKSGSGATADPFDCDVLHHYIVVCLDGVFTATGIHAGSGPPSHSWR